MHTRSTPRRWRVLTPDAEVVILASKVVVSDSGVLIALKNDGSPAHFFNTWHRVDDLDRADRHAREGLR